MALRSLDNALPAAIERPKKAAKVASPAPKPPALPEGPRDPGIRDENFSPLPKPAATEQSVEYIASENLKALPAPESKITNLLVELDSKDWLQACEALNDVRRLTVHHPSLLVPILEKVMLVMVKAMKSPRSALCKTSIMASADIFLSFGHSLQPTTTGEAAFDSLLLQLLLKASQDKRFVCEEAEKALQTMARTMSPLPLLGKLQAYVNHTNPRVRAKAAVAMSKCVSLMGLERMEEFGFAGLLRMAAELLNDRLPEAREAARTIISSMYGEFSKDAAMKADSESSSTVELWESFCVSSLPSMAALSVAKIFSQ